MAKGWNYGSTWSRWQDTLKKKKQQKLFEATVPELKGYIGRWVTIPKYLEHGGKKFKIDEIKVEIERLVGSVPYPNMYEINGEHHISMLRFHAQMERATDISEDDIEKFDSMEMSCEQVKS